MQDTEYFSYQSRISGCKDIPACIKLMDEIDALPDTEDDQDVTDLGESLMNVMGVIANQDPEQEKLLNEYFEAQEEEETDEEE